MKKWKYEVFERCVVVLQVFVLAEVETTYGSKLVIEDYGIQNVLLYKIFMV